MIVVDPSKRMTAQEALNHNWLADDGHSKEELYSGDMKGFNARKSFRRALFKLKSINLMNVINMPVDESVSGAEGMIMDIDKNILN